MATIPELIHQKASLRMSLVVLQNRINSAQQEGKDTIFLDLEFRATERALDLVQQQLPFG